VTSSFQGQSLNSFKIPLHPCDCDSVLPLGPTDPLYPSILSSLAWSRVSILIYYSITVYYPPGWTSYTTQRTIRDSTQGQGNFFMDAKLLGCVAEGSVWSEDWVKSIERARVVASCLLHRWSPSHSTPHLTPSERRLVGAITPSCAYYDNHQRRLFVGGIHCELHCR